jgi:hypothetical protein
VIRAWALDDTNPQHGHGGYLFREGHRDLLEWVQRSDFGTVPYPGWRCLYRVEVPSDVLHGISDSEVSRVARVRFFADQPWPLTQLKRRVRLMGRDPDARVRAQVLVTLYGFIGWPKHFLQDTFESIRRRWATMFSTRKP